MYTNVLYIRVASLVALLSGGIVVFVGLFFWSYRSSVTIVEAITGTFLIGAAMTAFNIWITPELGQLPRHVTIDREGIGFKGALFEGNVAGHVPWGNLTDARLIKRTGGVELWVRYVNLRRPHAPGYLRVRDPDTLLEAEPIRALLQRSGEE